MIQHQLQHMPRCSRKLTFKVCRVIHHSMVGMPPPTHEYLLVQRSRFLQFLLCCNSLSSRKMRLCSNGSALHVQHQVVLCGAIEYAVAYPLVVVHDQSPLFCGRVSCEIQKTTIQNDNTWST